MPDSRHQIHLSESDQPTRWYNVLHDLPTPPPPVLHPGTGQPVGPRGPGAAVPDGPDPAGGLAGPVRRDPRRGARRLPALAAVAAVPRAPAGEGARHAGADLLQVRGRVARPARTSRTPRCRRRTTTRKAGIKKLTTETGRGPVGHRAGVRLRAVRPRVRGLAGAGVVRPEALPPDHDRDLRRHRAPEPERPDRRPGARSSPRTRLHRQPRHRDQRGGRGGGAGPDDQLRPGQRAQPRAACTRP